MALDIIQTAYETNKKDARLLLMRESTHFGGSTCLQMAKIAQDVQFMSHQCVQDCLLKIWYDKILMNTPKTSV
jgi:hypothetical protein